MELPEVLHDPRRAQGKRHPLPALLGLAVVAGGGDYVLPVKENQPTPGQDITIENGLHGARDGTLREDASRIRKGSATQAMAIVRNLVIFLFNRRGYKNAAAATRHDVCQPQESLEVLSTPV